MPAPVLNSGAETYMAMGRDYTQRAVKTAEKFESFFLYRMLEAMQPPVDEKSAFNGGFAEEMFRPILNEHIADKMVERGGIGLADVVRSELLKHQEVEK